MTDDRRHAELGASKAARWMACPGSVRMARGAPDVDTVYAAEGRRAHSLAEARLRDDQPQLKALYDAEMWEHVDIYVQHVRERQAVITEMSPYRLPTALFIEETFDLGPLGADEEMYGTADAVLLGSNHLEVIDLKYGAGVLVEVNDNAQLLYYLVGALVTYGKRRLRRHDGGLWLQQRSLFDAAVDDFTTFRSTIVQPRAGHRDGPVRSADYTPEDVRQFVKILLQKARDTASPTAPLVPGAHCRFCPAHASCPAVKRYAMELAQADFSVVPVDAPPAPESLSLEVAADILRQAPILEDWLAALRARVERELMAGRDVRGWKLVDKRATRKWKDETTVGLPFPNTVMYETALRSPAQVEKLVGKKAFAERCAALVEKKSSGTTLVPESDARPAAAVGAQHEFAALAPGERAPSSAPILERNTE